MTLRIGAAAGRLDRLRVELLCVGIFEDERPLRGSAGLADWRLCGALSRLIRASRVRGLPGEALLIPGQGGLRARWVLALGLGRSAAFGPLQRRAATSEALERALALGAGSLAFPLIPSGGPLGGEVDAVLAGAAEVWGRAESRPAEFALALLVPAQRREELLRELEARAGEVPAGLRIVLPRDGEAAGRPRAGRPAAHADS